MESEEIRELRATLLRLKQEHRDLDSAINALGGIGPRRRPSAQAPQEEETLPQGRDRPHRGPAPARHHRLTVFDNVPCQQGFRPIIPRFPPPGRLPPRDCA